MKLLKTLGLAALLAASSLARAQAPAVKPSAVVVTNGQVRAVTGLLVAIQAEKMMRTVAGQSRYSNPAQQKNVFAKLEKVPPAQIYARLAYPLAKVISVETANEMARFYATNYGKKIVYSMYNSRGGIGEVDKPLPSKAERVELEKPAYIKAKRELDAVDPIIQHEAFKLLQAISKT